MTAHSTTLPEHLSGFTEALKTFLAELNSQTTVSVAFSGGLDSTVLLHLLSQHELSRPIKSRLYAHYVEHGLQAASLDWKVHCQNICNSFQVPFESSEIEIHDTQRKGVESVARKLRYQALSTQLPKDNDILVTGHHQRDQAETVLLNLARGAGVAGLSAMPYQKEVRLASGAVRSIRHIRPLLTIQYEKLVAYADYFQLSWIEDPSNDSLDFKRNVMRHEVLPALQAHWPNVEATIARSAQNMSEAMLLLDRMASHLLAPHKPSSYYLDLNLFEGLDWIEKKNVIRFWFSKTSSQPLTLKHYEWILSALLARGISRQNAFSYLLSDGKLAFYQCRLYYLPESPKSFKGSLDEFLSAVESYEEQGGVETVKSSESLAISSSYSLAVSRELLAKRHLIEVRSLSQGDDLKRKKLKQFFQENAIPVWERKVWPVMVLQGELVAVLGCSGCLTPLADTAKETFREVKGQVQIQVPRQLLWQLLGLN